MLSFRNGRRLLFGLAFVLLLGRTVLLVAQGRLSLLDLPQVLGAASALLLLGVLAARGGLRPPVAAAPAPTGPVRPAQAPGPAGPPGPPTSRFAAAPQGEQFATAAPPSATASASAPAPAFAAAPGSFSSHAAPSLAGSRPALRELTPLRSTTVASLASERTDTEPVAPAQPVAQDGERRWGSPAAPGSATQVLPQRGRGRRRPVPARSATAAVPKPAVAGRSTEPVVTGSPVAAAAAEPVLAPVAEPLPPVAAATPQPPALEVPAPRPAPATVDLTPRPGDPTVGVALLGPARAKLHELEPPLVRSWLTLLEAGQRGEPTPVLKAGQLAVLAAGLEDAAVRRRLLRAVADPLVDAVGLVTQDLPLDGLDCASAPAGRVAAARDLLLLVARTTTGTPAQGAAVRAVKWLDRPAQG